MSSSCKLFVSVVVLLALPLAATAQKPAGDRDDQFVVRGCVTPASEIRADVPQSLYLWSRGDVYLAYPDTRFKPAETERPIGTTGVFMPVFYWIDDENDFAKYKGQRVEIVGELSDDFKKGEFEIKQKDNFTEIEFEVKGREAKARIPTDWFGPQTRAKNAEFDVAVRTVDVEKVTVLGPCSSR